jgi:Flp pilus assembly protein TadG
MNMRSLRSSLRRTVTSPRALGGPTQHGRRERGQSLVEIAISMLFLIWLIAAIIDLGSALFTWISLRDAAQEGALYGSLNPTDSSGIRRRVITASNRPVDLAEAFNGTPQTLTITPTYTGTPPCTGDSITVALVYQYTPIIAFVSAIWPTIPIHATVTDTVLLPACPSSP